MGFIVKIVMIEHLLYLALLCGCTELEMIFGQAVSRMKYSLNKREDTYAELDFRLCVC